MEDVAERKAVLRSQREQERIFGNRQPKIIQDIKPENETKTNNNEPRKTGAVTRSPVVRQEPRDPNQTPDFNPQPNYPTRTTGGGKSNDDEDRKNEQRKIRQKERDENQTPPIFQPQPQRQKEDEPWLLQLRLAQV